MTISKTTTKAQCTGDKIIGLLNRWTDGDKDCLRQIFPMVYDQLEKRAARCLMGESNSPMETGDLLSETYSRLHFSTNMRFRSTNQFLAFANETMRRILIEKARARNTRKRGDGQKAVPLDGLENTVRQPSTDPDQKLAVKQVLAKLRRSDRRKAGMLEMVYLKGMKAQELGHIFNLTPASIRREIRQAREWMAAEISKA